MDGVRQRKIASKGGRAAHQKGTAHEFDSAEARVAGRKGGLSVSQNRAHMAAIGRHGGQARGQKAQAAHADEQMLAAASAAPAPAQRRQTSQA